MVGGDNAGVMIRCCDLSHVRGDVVPAVTRGPNRAHGDGDGGDRTGVSAELILCGHPPAEGTVVFGDGTRVASSSAEASNRQPGQRHPARGAGRASVTAELPVVVEAP